MTKTEEMEACPFCGRAGVAFMGGVFKREQWAACYGTKTGAEHAYIAMPLTEWNRRPTVPEGLAPDVRRLVIAARIVAFEDQGPGALRELDQASEAFASRVPWENENG